LRGAANITAARSPRHQGGRDERRRYRQTSFCRTAAGSTLRRRLCRTSGKVKTDVHGLPLGAGGNVSLVTIRASASHCGHCRRHPRGRIVIGKCRHHRLGFTGGHADPADARHPGRRRRGTAAGPAFYFDPAYGRPRLCQLRARRRARITIPDNATVALTHENLVADFAQAADARERIEAVDLFSAATTRHLYRHANTISRRRRLQLQNYTVNFWRADYGVRLERARLGAGLDRRLIRWRTCRSPPTRRPRSSNITAPAAPSSFRSREFSATRRPRGGAVSRPESRVDVSGQSSSSPGRSDANPRRMVTPVPGRSTTEAR